MDPDSPGPHFVTLRLADALPRSVVEAWHDDVDRHTARLSRARGRDLTEHEAREVAYRSMGRVDRYLDQGRGRALFRDERAASAVEAALWSGDGERYRLLAWCVMPNHVHVLVAPCPGHGIDGIVGDWKAESTRLVNQELGRTGTLWHPDALDQRLTHPSDVDRIRSAILRNPETANLGEWPFVGSASMRAR